MITLLVITD